MQISTDLIKSLREQTGAGIMDCNRALTEAGGNIEKANEILAQRGLALASKKSDRTTGEGIIDAYVHLGGKVGAMVELKCETDFVARTNEFKELAHDIALQIAAMSPQFISQEEVAQEEDIDPKTACLLLQPFIKDPTKSIQDLITETIAKVGENIKIHRFVRFELGL